MIKIYETAVELCTEQLYSLLIFPCTVKYKSESSSSLFFILFILFWSLWYILLCTVCSHSFNSILTYFCPLPPTCFWFALRSKTGCLTQWYLLLLLGLIKLLSIYFPWVPVCCSSFLMSPVYLVWSKKNSRYLCSISYFSVWATYIRIIQTAWERRGRICKPSLQPLHHPVLSTDAESAQPAQDKHKHTRPGCIKAWAVKTGLESQRLR